MDITVGPLVNLWGFGPDKHPVAKCRNRRDRRGEAAHRPAAPEAYQRQSRGSGCKHLPDMYVDLSTLGEGYGADELVRLMNRNGITNYLVSVGGAVSSRGVNGCGKPRRVAIKNRPTVKCGAGAGGSTVTASAPPAATATTRTKRPALLPCHRSDHRQADQPPPVSAT
ncbi:FAD:protein FMN transferase [Serratia ureilytica]